MDRFLGTPGCSVSQFGLLRPAWTHPSRRLQYIVHEPQVKQQRQRNSLCNLDDKAFELGFAIVNLALHDSGLMFDSGSDRVLQILRSLKGLRRTCYLGLGGSTFGGFHCRIPAGSKGYGIFACLDAGAAIVTKDRFLRVGSHLVCSGDVGAADGSWYGQGAISLAIGPNEALESALLPITDDLTGISRYPLGIAVRRPIPRWGG